MNTAAFSVIFNRFVDNVTHLRLEGLQNSDLVLLLQDDVVFPSDFSNKFKRSYHALPRNWTVARLSWWGERFDEDVVNAYWSHCPIIGTRTYPSQKSRKSKQFYHGSGAVLLRAGAHSVHLNRLLQESKICWEDGAFLSISRPNIASYVHTESLIKLTTVKSIIQSLR